MSTDQRDKSSTIKNKTGLEKHFEQYNPKPKLKMVDESSNAECQSNLSSEEEWEDEGGKTSKGTKT